MLNISMFIESIIVTNIFSNLMLFSIVFLSIFLIIAVFFVIGWRLAAYKNRHRLKWAIIISISGFYGMIVLAALDKINQ